MLFGGLRSLSFPVSKSLEAASFQGHVLGLTETSEDTSHPATQKPHPYEVPGAPNMEFSGCALDNESMYWPSRLCSYCFFFFLGKRGPG